MVDDGDAALRQRLQAELAALGEDETTDDELAFVHASAAGSESELEPWADPDVQTVATLAALSTWQPPAEGLLPLERHRVWRKVAAHPRARVGSSSAAGHDPSISSAGHEAANDGAQGLVGWRGLVVGLALVAGVALVPRFESAPPSSPEDLADQKELARMLLDGLPGEQDGARARSLADSYAQRLQASQQTTPQSGRDRDAEVLP